MRLLQGRRISQLQANLASNFAGRMWSALLGIVFVPVYIRYLGIESYGLIGFYAALQATAQLLDFGLAPMLNRELARYSALPDRRGDSRDLVRTVEAGYWGLGAALVLGAWVLAPFLGGRWIQAQGIPPSAVEGAIRSMAIVLGLQWPLGIYYSGLMGLQRQGRANVLRIVMTTLAAAGSALVLATISAEISAFFLWQGIVAAVHLIFAGILLWRSLPPSDHAPRITWSLLKGSWKFAAGMTGITVTAVVATQLDKVVLSGLLSLEMFGYYSLAWVLAGGLRTIAGPIFDTVFPRFSALMAAGDEASLKALYHRTAQLMSTLIVPVAAVLAVFPSDVIRLWTGDPSTATATGPLLALLAIGTGFNALWTMPYALQLAGGWTGLALSVNIALVGALTVGLVLLTPQLGAAGAAGVWAVFNGAGFLAASLLTHRWVMRGGWWEWFRTDVLAPVVSAAAVVALFRYAEPNPLEGLPLMLWLGACALLAAAASCTASPQLRSRAFAYLGSGRVGR